MAKNSITVSFKPKDKKEQELKKWVENKIGGYSPFIKNLLLKAKEEEDQLNNKKRMIADSNDYNNCPSNTQTNNQNGLIDLSDF